MPSAYLMAPVLGGSDISSSNKLVLLALIKWIRELKPCVLLSVEMVERRIYGIESGVGVPRPDVPTDKEAGYGHF